MDKDILDMMKKVSIINLLFGIVLGILAQVLFKAYGLFVMLGMIIGIFNFLINGTLGALAFEKFKNSSASLYMISFIIRIVIAAGIGYYVFRYNKYYTVAYLFGYTAHLMGVYIYSVINNK